jgi:energy-coupling factor transport system permease protein
VTGRAPGPLLALGALAATLAFTSDDPVVLGALLAGALLLGAAAPRGIGRVLLVTAAVSAAGLVLITPLVAAQGDLVLLRGPDIPLLDTEVTLEELVAGLASGMRLAAVVVLTGAVLAHADPDRLLGLASRLAPRSALVVALAARLVPTLERDARAIAEGARLRGVALTDGPWAGRIRRAGPLMLPLLGSSLERGLDVAEAMTARGYGAGPRTRPPAPPRARAETVVWALAGVLAAVTAWALATGAGEFQAFPVLGPLPAAPAVALAVAAAGVLAAAAGALRR